MPRRVDSNQRYIITTNVLTLRIFTASIFIVVNFSPILDLVTVIIALLELVQNYHTGLGKKMNFVFPVFSRGR